MPESIGTAYVQIEPSFEGVVSKVDKELGGAGKSGGKSFGQGFASVVGTAGKVVAGAVAAGATAVAGITKGAISAFGEYEQLAGGVEKIFDGMDTNKIITDASNAYKDLGLSANQYLATINDVGATFASTMGAEAGYDTAKKGLQAISDYASGTGKNVDLLSDKFTMITRSTSSYQSIADQFSGILPATSAAFLEQAKNAGFLADKYKNLTDVPIEEYQQAVTDMLSKGVDALNLTGNTADEATKTFTGSLAMMKSSWQNTITAIGQGDMSIISNNIDNLIESTKAFANNIMPIVQSSLKGIAQLIQELAPMIAAELPGLVTDIIPPVIDAAVQIIDALAKGLTDALPAVVNTLAAALPTIIDTFMTILPKILEVGLDLIMELAKGIVQALPTLMPKIVDIILQITDWLLDNIDMVIDVGIELIMVLIQGILDALPRLLEKAPEIIIKVAAALIRALPKILQAGVELILMFIKGIVDQGHALMKAGIDIVNKVKEGFSGYVQQAKNWGKDMIQNFIDGILAKWNDLKASVKSVAQTVKEFLGFSEPDKGPLSNFHTFAPDMMELYAQGIRQNAGLVKNALTDATSDIMSSGINVESVQSIQSSVSASNVAQSEDRIGRIESLLSEFIANFKQDIYLDTGALVGGTVAAYNTALGRIAVRGGSR